MNDHSVKSCLPFAADTGLVLQALLSAISNNASRRFRLFASGECILLRPRSLERQCIPAASRHTAL